MFLTQKHSALNSLDEGLKNSFLMLLFVYVARNVPQQEHKRTTKQENSCTREQDNKGTEVPQNISTREQDNKRTNMIIMLIIVFSHDISE